ncbi:MAG TPA: DUF3859 domain-containing protein [Gammaproteobacteria bacterium]|nr:DUF3859 domain-containing protein [Gammaproteobacteria bacterium]
MRYLVPVVLILALFGCEQNASQQTDNASLSEPGRVAVAKTPDYLNKPLQGKVTQRGLYRMVRSGGIVDDARTTTGKVVASPVIELVRSTERIPLVKGAQMYLQYRIWPLPNQPAYVELRRVLKHPEMTLPDGSVTTGSDFMVRRKVSSNHVIVYTGYGFDEDYELVEGDWVFQIWRGDQKLIEQKFTTYRPDPTEIASLRQVLDLGNKVLTRMESPHNPNPGLNWPRVVVGDKDSDVPAGVAEIKRSTTGIPAP